jgi:multiple sugar transport system ATP-binding protein
VNGLKLVTAQGEIALGSVAQASALERWLDREVVLGVRPEALRLLESSTDAALGARLEVIEPVGNEVFLNLRYGSQTLVARTPPRTLPEPGSTLQFGFASERLHFFDPQQGLRIAAPND